MWLDLEIWLTWTIWCITGNAVRSIRYHFLIGLGLLRCSKPKNSEIMYQFYVIYKDNSQIKGEVSSRDIFIQRFINPCIDDIDTYQIWKEEEEDFDDSFDSSSIFDGTPDWIRMMD